MNNGEKYSLDLPYPHVSKIIEKDRAFAGRINISRVGELQTISEYIYQSIILEEKYPDIRTTLEGISIVEMRHYKILSQLILRLGGDPKLNNRIRTLPLDILDKNECDILYKIQSTIKQNISCELAAANEYRQLASISCDRKISTILERIADDEELHAEIFEKLLRKLTF